MLVLICFFRNIFSILSDIFALFCKNKKNGMNEEKKNQEKLRQIFRRKKNIHNNYLPRILSDCVCFTEGCQVISNKIEIIVFGGLPVLKILNSICYVKGSYI